MSEGAPARGGLTADSAVELKARPMSGADAEGAVDAGSLDARIEAILLCAERPVSVSRLALSLGLSTVEVLPGGDENAAEGADAAGAPNGAKRARSGRSSAKSGAGNAVIATPGKMITQAVERLNGAYAKTGRSFRIEPVAGGFRLMTLAAFAPDVRAYQGAKEQASLSRAAIETLAIVAYKQPMTRATLEAIRGVACGDVLRSLMDRRLVTISGRAEELGRPMLYATTRQFLEAFGLGSLKDLPTMEEFRGQAVGGGGGGGTPESDD